VDYSDPYVPEIAMDGGAVLRSRELMGAVREADVVVVVTDHSAYPYADIVAAAAQVVDTRNATKGIVSEKIVKL
jgi:UDP-N-acetyl-D-glucosamine dehydrogenase